MKTALIASRHLTGTAHYETVKAALIEFGTTELHHGAEGAAREHAECWAAGPIRGKALIAAADTVLALWDGESQGTANELKEARRQGKRVRLLLA